MQRESWDLDNVGNEENLPIPSYWERIFFALQLIAWPCAIYLLVVMVFSLERV